MNKIYYHYCSLDTLMNIVKERKIRLCNVAKMNDKEEGLELENIMEEIVVENGYQEKNPEVMNLIKIYIDYKYDRHIPYIACFSQKNDKLSQWRACSSDGQGVTIGFDFNELERIEEKSPILIKNLNNRLGFSKIICKIND